MTMGKCLLQLFLLIIVKLLPVASAAEWGLWPLVTPVLGNLSEECQFASTEYIMALNEIITNPNPDPSNMWAAQMFDAGGNLPFLQEGIFSDTRKIDLNICEFVEDIGGMPCESLPDSVTTLHFAIPIGYANAPGSEPSCRKVTGVLSNGQELKPKYCHNYIVYIGQNYTVPEVTKHTAKQSDDKMRNILAHFKTEFTPQKRRYIENNLPRESNSLLSIDSSQLVNPFSKRLRTLSSYQKSIELQVSEMIQAICEDCIGPKEEINIVNAIVSVLLSLWYVENGFRGMGVLAPGAYYGGCYPQSCTVQDLQNNADAFSGQFGIPLTSSPEVPNFNLMAPDFFSEEVSIQMMKGSIGCSDFEKYNEGWNADNYAAVIAFIFIGFLICLGTVIEVYENIKKSELIDSKVNQSSTTLSIIKSFSLIKNLQFIFGVTKPGTSERLGCLEGMRAISMTWVILGHNFLFGSMFMQINNGAKKDLIQNHGTSLAFEAVLQGEFSVDSFFFVGATLVSYLLLKDLDKTNGWLNFKGMVHMILFYVNRYLRITIPYAFVMALFIGIMPLVITEPIGAASWAVQEADVCKEFAWTHFLYINIFYETGGYCIGQTWFLSTDMMFYFLSPLIIYPLWTSKFGRVQKILSHSWWFLLVCSSLGLSYHYASNYETWNEWNKEYSLPSFDFAPWGFRNQCYLVGIMVGYLLHVTKGKPFEIDTRLNLFIWQVVFLAAFAVVYSPHDPDIYNVSNKSIAYMTFHKFAWGMCLAWVTFSCCRGTGGLVNDFLSWDFFLPIAKTSFMTYLLHMDFNWYYFNMQDYTVDLSMWLMTQIFVAQLAICLFLGVIFSLALEIPFSKIQKIVIQLLVGLLDGKSIQEVK